MNYRKVLMLVFKFIIAVVLMLAIKRRFMTASGKAAKLLKNYGVLSTDITTKLEELTQNGANKLVMYSSPGCPYCVRQKDAFDRVPGASIDKYVELKEGKGMVLPNGRPVEGVPHFISVSGGETHEHKGSLFVAAGDAEEDYFKWLGEGEHWGM